MNQPLVRLISPLIFSLFLSEIRWIASLAGLGFSRHVKDTLVIFNRGRFRQAKRPKQTTLPVGQGIGIGVVIVAVMMVGLLALLLFILTKYPWGTAPGCWAQC